MDVARDLHRLLDEALGDDPHRSLVAVRRLTDERWLLERRADERRRRELEEWAETTDIVPW